MNGANFFSEKGSARDSRAGFGDSPKTSSVNGEAANPSAKLRPIHQSLISGYPQIFLLCLLLHVSFPVVKTLHLTAVLEREGTGYVSLCPELDIASQGDTAESATANLREAVELFLECADSQEIEGRFKEDILVTQFEAAYA